MATLYVAHLTIHFTRPPVSAYAVTRWHLPRGARSTSFAAPPPRTPPSDTAGARERSSPELPSTPPPRRDDVPHRAPHPTNSAQSPPPTPTEPRRDSRSR